MQVKIFLKKASVAIFLLSLIFLSGCKKFVEVQAPITSITGSNVFNSDATAAAVLTGIYTNMSSAYFAGLQGITSISLAAGLSADELTLYSSSNTAYLSYYKNDLSVSTAGSEYWSNLYPIVYITNSVIDGLPQSANVSKAVRDQLMGEAKFLRGFCYFYLVNLYGDVPLITTTDYKISAGFARAAKSLVFQQIVQDLKDAQDLLSTSYLDGTIVKTTTKRLRPNKWVATALLSRVYLCTGDWAEAEEQASSLIDNVSTYSLVSDINQVFSSGSKEAIWQLQPVNTGENTPDGIMFVLPDSGPDNNTYPVYASTTLVNSFENGDSRKSKWLNSITVGSDTFYYPFKYKATTIAPVDNIYPPATEYSMVFRLAEQYLIRAEARARLGTNLSDGIADLDLIRNRAELPLISTTNPGISQTELLDKILHERQVELFTEWGHRWLDLKRTGNADAVMGAVTSQKGGTWQTSSQLYPVPLFDIQRNPNLTQNPGY